MINNSYYSQDVHGPYELHDIGNHDLEEGGTIRGCTLAYATFGTLNDAKDNAILIPTWYSGTNKIIEQVYIGEGRVHARQPLLRRSFRGDGRLLRPSPGTHAGGNRGLKRSQFLRYSTEVPKRSPEASTTVTL